MSNLMVVGNWKMNGSTELVHSVVACLGERLGRQSCEVVICPPSVYLDQLSAMLRVDAPNIKCGAQNLAAVVDGAQTGEISGRMLAEVGCQYVIVGHSERRQDYGETDEIVAEKFAMAQLAGLIPILCVGESLQEREMGLEELTVKRQLDAVLDFCGSECFKSAVVAYEPVWAIGTGKTASTDQAQAMHKFIRQYIMNKSGLLLEGLKILYGGSVNAGNSSELFSMNDIDGGLVGGASLDAEKFLSICNSVKS